MQTAMVISPHADDAAAFCGATLAKFTDQGWNVILVRVTDDSKDSFSLSVEETIQTNSAQLRTAADILGISEIVELGYPTDCLGDVSRVELRERFVYLFRKYQPFAVFSFDPDGLFENNLDHLVVAQAVDEAFWVSCFDKHHPEHFDEGLKPFAVCEHWYFARQLPETNHVEEVTHYMGKKVQALCAHKTMMAHIFHQYQMQLKTWGRRVPWLDASLEDENFQPLLALAMQEQGNAVAKEFNLGEGMMAEAFRLERFGDLEEMFQALSDPIAGAEEPPKREGLDLPAQSSPWSQDQIESIIPININRRIRLMGHHHLCVGAFDKLLNDPGFSMEYAELVSKLNPSPEMEIESIYGYDVFCYQCGYWSEEEGRCSTGWKNKISKDAAVLNHLGLKTGQITPFERMQHLLAERITPKTLERFCSAGKWKCEFYILGACQQAYADLRDRFEITVPEEERIS